VVRAKIHIICLLATKRKPAEVAKLYISDTIFTKDLIHNTSSIVIISGSGVKIVVSTTTLA
jgi:hypothetical protein